tara:strand:+ start:3918 stop:4136 length:219 start_codon:yes stop_codon:yes gene_type:complete
METKTIKIKKDGEGKMKVSKHDFWNYAQLQEEGCINMCDVSSVVEITGLDRNKILMIMEDYDGYKELYGVEK